MTFIYTLNAPKLGSLNGFEIFLDTGFCYSSSSTGVVASNSVF